MAYFLHEKWTAFLSINTQVDGQKYFYLDFGPDFYPLRDVIVMPFVSARLLYTMMPAGTPGWLSHIGVEIPLGTSREVENFRFRVSSGFGGFFLDGQDSYFVEMARVGLIWSF